MSDEEKDVDFGAGGFFMLYKNEGDQAVRQFAVDFTALNEQAKREKFSKDTYSGVLYGFESAVRIVLGNYNLTPRNEAVDSMAESQRFTELFEKAVEEEKTRQEEENGQEASSTRDAEPTGTTG